MPLILTLIALAGGAGAAWLALESRREGEVTAARRARDLGLLWTALWLALAWAPVPGARLLGLVLAGLLALALIALLVPTGRPRRANSAPTARLDERTAMFARADLEPGTERFDRHYEEFPQHREADDAWRALPGLLSPDANRAEPVAFAAANASFDAIGRLAVLKRGEPADRRQDLDPAMAARFVKGWARKLGALDVGVTRLRPHHLYAIKGRGSRWGEPIELDHAWAIAFTVEMDSDSLGAAPEGVTIMESAQQYLASGAIAVQLTTAIRRLGWPAEAHLDAHYEVVCPLVAKDAGLGEIGRMGLLMTPRLGPRVRIAVVTTDLPLAADEPTDDGAVLDFCDVCRKCADICPARAVPEGAPEPVEGIDRWRIDQEACFTYWCRSGTDCGQCIRVCPYAKPDSPLHAVVRRGLRHSSLFRRLAVRLDDLLYGRRPASRPVPAWLPKREGSRST
ncbi:MAG: 4Fe-4S dicluster domain-containing protein [bacterium]|nr:4Fe-4S dicluster domain-containing protein [bacterium]